MINRHKVILLWAVLQCGLFVWLTLCRLTSQGVNCGNGKDNPQISIVKTANFSTNFHPSCGLIDASHNYKSHMFTVVASNWSSLAKKHVCLATHATFDHMQWVTDLADVWSRSISLAIFTPDIEHPLVEAFIAYLHACHPAVKEKVSFHFVYPLEKPPKKTLHEIPSEIISNCSRNGQSVLQDLLNMRPVSMLKEWRTSLPYPQNVLRNIARKSCPTEFVLTPDIDMLPTVQTFADELEEFLINSKYTNCSKCAFVLPIYEIHNSLKAPPSNKTQLVKLISSNLAQGFHIKVFDKNQLNSQLETWQTIPVSPKLDVAYESAKYSFFYEPVYVAKSNIPQFDERFVGYGNTRNTQVYEMYVQGWKFLLLNNAFLVHWGFQNATSYSKYRVQEREHNRHLVKDFVRDMAVHYDKDPLNLLRGHCKIGTKIIVARNN